MGNIVDFSKPGLMETKSNKPERRPTFHHQFGFKKQRRPKVMYATEEEMKAAQLHPSERDYCAHLLIKYLKCKQDYWPFPVMCAHERHVYMGCQYEDFTMQSKEYEREKRLKERQKRIDAAAAAVTVGA